ncbi:MAG: type II secretion system F family protein [Candidatus Babeliales bacterium]
MPYFKWRGINLKGKIVKGIVRTSSVQELDQQLFENEVALLGHKQIEMSSVLRPITATMKAHSFKHMALLLESGVFLDHALEIICAHNNHRAFKEILEDIHYDVSRGLTMADACAKFPTIFDSITLSLLQTGQHAGKLPSALSMLADHIESVAAFYKKLRSAAFLPGITFLFFIAISIIILIFIVPSFASMFSNVGQPLPATTSWLLWMSSLLTHNTLLFLLLFIVFSFVGLRTIYYHTKVKAFCDVFVLRLPMIGNVLQQTTVMYCLRSVGILIQNGVSIVPAFQAIIPCIHNNYIKNEMMSIVDQLDKGYSLTQACKGTKSIFFDEIFALIHIGEESGTLGIVLNKAADVYKDRIHRTLFFLTTVFQPLLMIVLGMLILGLIVTVYMPILNLSYTIA